MSTKYGGYMGNILKIDLTMESYCIYPWNDKDRELYLGGKIMAAKILYDNIEKETETDPLSPQNILVISTGPLTGTGVPSSSRFNISTLSPLTGFIASSNCGGNFGIFLKKAGYDGLIITGKAKNPKIIEIEDEKITFKDANNLWGKTVSKTQEIIGGKSGKIVIGPAGENLVKYASIFSEDRAAGRAGVGAVMGSKNLKAVVVTGSKSVPVYNRETLKKINKAWVIKLRKHPITGKQLPRLGTAGLLTSMNARKILATRNYKYGQFKDFEMISGEFMAEKYLIKNKGCITCPIQCGRLVEVDGKKVKGPELETLGLLGSNILNNSLELILKWNYELDELGMDTISTGSTIAFAMELNEKGLWKNGLEFGNTKNISSLFYDIAYRRGIGDILAEGSKRISDIYGGGDYAIHSKGLELAAYEPRGAVGQGLGYAVSNRGGCHINGGYLVVLEGLGLRMDPFTTKSKAPLAVMFQNVMEGVSAGGNCIFTTYAMLPGIIISKPNSLLSRFVNVFLKHSGGVINIINRLPDLLLNFNLKIMPHTYAIKAVTGMKISFGKLRSIGERGYNLERLFNIKMGLSYLDDDLPKRLKEEGEPSSNKGRGVPLDKLKKKYYKARGWSKLGIPNKATIKRLGLEWVLK